MVRRGLVFGTLWYNISVWDEIKIKMRGGNFKIISMDVINFF